MSLPTGLHHARDSDCGGLEEPRVGEEVRKGGSKCEEGTIGRQDSETSEEEGGGRMKTGEIDYANRKASEVFDRWNNVTGYVHPCSSYYYELLSIIEDAVHIGAQMALYGKISFDDEGRPLRRVGNRIGNYSDE